MKLKSLNRYIGFLILFISFLPLNAEEEIDIWNKNIKEKSEINNPKINSSDSINNPKVFSSNKINNDIEIEDKISENYRFINRPLRKERGTRRLQT